MQRRCLVRQNHILPERRTSGRPLETHFPDVMVITA